MESTTRRPTNVDTLIEIEWDTIADLKNMLADPELSKVEKIRAANALAYHATVLNKLLVQKGETPKFDDETLGHFVKRYGNRTCRRVVRDFRTWKRATLHRR